MKYPRGRRVWHPFDFCQSRTAREARVAQCCLSHTICYKRCDDFSEESWQTFAMVDQLCIEQDNSAQKHSSIQLMDIIYRQSRFTIVAFAASKSSDELLGIRPHSLIPPNHTELINGKTFVARRCWRVTNHISQSMYETWAWNFAERLLYPRCLYFTADLVMYYCKNGCSDEAWDYLLRNSNVPIQNIISTLAQDHNAAIRFYWQLNRTFYENLVGLYMQRYLGFPSDKLNAFRAFLSMIDSGYSRGTICGLLEACFDDALLWQPVYHGGPPILRASYFASWSWAGWSGPVTYTSQDTATPLVARLADVQHSFQIKRRSLK